MIADVRSRAAPVPAEQRVGWFRQAVTIRLFEDKVQELYLQGLVQGTTHLAQGQEAVSVGAVGAMEPDDYLTITYRGHGQAVARGMDLDAAFAEMMGRADGCCGGVGGSMHLTEFSRGLIGAFAIVGAGLPVALGAAMSAQLRGTKQVALTFFGDGAVNIGTFHESLNMAAIYKAPIVFICENNLYGEFTPMRHTSPLEHVADRAAAYAIPGISVDGQDVDAVYAATAEAIARARAGEGPTLIEAKTYRYRGHSRSDPAKYRPPGELDAWKARDPIDILGARLAEDGSFSADEQARAREEIQTHIDAAAARAAESPFPQLEETRRYVYADRP